MLKEQIPAIKKQTLEFKEYMAMEVKEIEKAMKNMEFIKHVQDEFHLDSKTLPNRNQFAEIWNNKNSADFRERMEKQYIILGRG